MPTLAHRPLLAETLRASVARVTGQRPSRVALTLHPEWVPMIAWLDKRTENRSWPCPPGLIGHEIVLHAGKLPSLARVPEVNGWTSFYCDGSRSSGFPGRLQAVVDTAEHAGWRVAFHVERDAAGKLRLQVDWDAADAAGALSGQAEVLGSRLAVVARIVGCDQEVRSPWDARGQWHWRLDDVRRLEDDREVVGHQGLWRLP